MSAWIWSCSGLMVSAHAALERQPGQGLAVDVEVRNVAQGAKTIASQLRELRNNYGTGHGRAFVSNVAEELVIISVDAAMLWWTSQPGRPLKVPDPAGQRQLASRGVDVMPVETRPATGRGVFMRQGFGAHRNSDLGAYAPQSRSCGEGPSSADGLFASQGWRSTPGGCAPTSTPPAASRVLLALVEAGMGRDEAYKIVQSAAMASWETGVPFRDTLAQAGVDVPLDAFDPARFLARHTVVPARLDALKP